MPLWPVLRPRLHRDCAESIVGHRPDVHTDLGRRRLLTHPRRVSGSQFTSVRYGESLAKIGAVPSIGTVGDSYDNALAATVNGRYKAELH